jgi:hypothetical protein
MVRFGGWPSRLGDPLSILDQFVCDLLKIKWYLDTFFCEYFSFPLSVSSHWHNILKIHYRPPMEYILPN